MSSYFPLPPDIFIEDLSLHVYGSLTFLNVPNNRLKESFFGKEYNTVIYLGIYKLEKKIWILIKVQKMFTIWIFEIERKQLGVYKDEIVVLIPKKNKNFPKLTKELPCPDKLRYDKSPVAERCSLNFSFKKFYYFLSRRISFQNDDSKKSSFLSFDTLKNCLNNKVVNYLIFMNILRDSDSTENVLIKVFDPNNRQIKTTINAKKMHSQFIKFQKKKIQNLKILHFFINLMNVHLFQYFYQ